MTERLQSFWLSLCHTRVLSLSSILSKPHLIYLYRPVDVGSLFKSDWFLQRYTDHDTLVMVHLPSIRPGITGRQLSRLPTSGALFSRHPVLFSNVRFGRQGREHDRSGEAAQQTLSEIDRIAKQLPSEWNRRVATCGNKLVITVSRVALTGTVRDVTPHLMGR